METKKAILTVISWLPWLLFAQGMHDSIIQLPAVDVIARGHFEPETAGMKYTRIDSTVFSQKLHLSLSELLSENTSVFIKSHGRGALATASFRGTAPSHTRVNWNGISINSPMTGMVDFSLIPVFIMDAMELKHGAASVADGSGGLGGSIQLRNTANWDRSFSADYLQVLGSYKTFEEYLRAGLGNSKLQWDVRAYYNSSDNDYTFLNKAVGDIVDGQIVHPLDTNRNAGYKKYGLLQELYYQPSNVQIISLKWWSQWADRTIPQLTSYEGPDHSNLNSQVDSDHKVVADWTHYSEKGKMLVRSGFSRKRLDFSVKNHISGVGLLPVVCSESKLQSLYNHIDYTYRLNERFSFSASFDLNLHEVESNESVSKSGYQRKRQDYSLFVSSRYSMSDRLNLNLMLRQNMVDADISPLIPYLGFDFRVLQGRDLIFKTSVSHNHHYPSLNDLYWQPGGNPGLLPEEGFGLESGLLFRGKRGVTSVRSEVTAFRTDVTNWIIWVPSFKGYWEPQNISRVLTRGLEFNAHIETSLGAIGLTSSASYAYTRSINYGDKHIWGDASYGKQLPYIPIHSGNVFVNFEYHGFNLAWQHNSYSERFTTSSNDVSRRDWLYPYFMNDLSMGKELALNRLQCNIELRIMNLFDETYHTVLYRPMPGRHFMVRVRVRVNSGTW
jgi:outer membrane cobalamin receptor